MLKDITSKENMAEAIRQRMNVVGVDRQLGGYEAQVIAAPAPGYQVEPRATPVFLAGGVGGLLLGVALAWLAEVTDRSFRTAEEIRRRLGLEVVGYLPRIVPDPRTPVRATADGPVLDPTLCAYHRPKSPEAEAFRGLRTALYFNTHGEDHRVLQVTSPNKGDGKTTLAANLAVSMAQSGKTVLLVDADCRRPRVHKVFGLGDEVGLVSVIEAQATVEEAVRPTGVANLTVLPCGPRPGNPAELLTSPRFGALLEELRGRYDFVLLDTPPLLAVSDPAVVAPQVDGVLLNIRVTKNSRPAAERAKEILLTLGAKIIGVVVNGVGDKGTGYDGYGYGYRYRYESAENGSYYHEPDAGEEADGDEDAAPPEAPRRGRKRRTPAGLYGWLRTWWQ
jgi:capsular exopolysaccharide synthesis family protein